MRTLTATMNDYTREELRDTLISVMRKGNDLRARRCDLRRRPPLGLLPSDRRRAVPIKSAINSGIRQGILGYEGSVIWREA